MDKDEAIEMRKRMYEQFVRLGVILEDGRSFLKEVTVTLENFRVIIRPNESQHRGRPHCMIEMGEDSATFDIHTGKVMAGTLKSWTRRDRPFTARRAPSMGSPAG